MGDNTPQEIIDAEKRKLQKQAISRMDPGFDVGQAMFETEMKDAEAKGDLPPVRVYGDEDDMEVIRSMKGGETPTQAAKTYEETIAGRDKRGWELGQRMESVMAKVRPPSQGEMSQSEFSSVMELIAEGKATLADPELQKEAFDVATKLRELYKSESDPEGYIPSYGYSGGNKGRDLEYEGFPVREAVKKGELK